MGVWVTLLRVVTTIAQIIMVLSPGLDVYKVHKRKSTGEMVVLPLISLILPNQVWLIYGFLSDSLFPLVLTTLIGEIAGIVFTAVYFYWSPDRPYVLKACAVVFVGWLAFSIYVVLGETGVTHQSGDEVTDVVGYAGAVLSTLLFASPLEALWQVFKTKSVASIPINFSVMVAVACALWVGIAFVDDDLFILVPNAAGVVLAAIQIVVYLIYRPRRGNDAALEDLGEDAPDCIAVIVSPKGGWPTTNKSPVYQPLASPLKPAIV